MNFGDWLVGVITVMYACAAMAYLFSRNWPAVIVFAGYAVANVGMIWMTTGGKI